MDSLALFPTPVGIFQLDGLDALNSELSARLLDERRAAPGVTRSNVGGWHSEPDLSRRPEPCWRALMQLVVDHAGQTMASFRDPESPPMPHFRYGLQAWAMVMSDGDYTVLHDHGDAHWSAVYYIDEGEAPPPAHPQSGALVFSDPRRGGRPIPGLELVPGTFALRPRTGMLVIFPGSLQHYVHAYRGARPRICVSVNIVLDLAPRP